MAPRYTVQAFAPDRPTLGPVHQQETEEWEVAALWASREYPRARIVVRDEYAGTSEVFRDWEGDEGTARRIVAAFTAWAIFPGEPVFDVRLAGGRFQVVVPIGGGVDAYDVLADGQGFRFVEAGFRADGNILAEVE